MPATKVLVFESDAAFAGELRNELDKLGCTTTVVDDGNVGLQQAAAERPDLILLSIELPRMNGFSVCNKLKKDSGLKDVPLIIMSSESSDETFEQHKKLRTRAEDYVHKPIAFGELLQHIQTFVTLGSGAAAPSGEAEDAIVIDDEIEISPAEDAGEDEGTQIAVRPPSFDAPISRREKVDADVDAFADAAFGRLTDDPPPATHADPPGPNGAVATAAAEVAHAPAPRRASSLPPAAARAPSMRPAAGRPPTLPPAAVDVGEYEKLREDLVRTREHASEVERELGDARSEIEKLRLEVGESERLTREIEELKSKLASTAKSGGISSRDFLDLREALNKKDKDILALREQLARKDKELVEARERTLGFERAKADLDDRLLGVERELAEARDKGDALAADKDLARKAAEDFKARLEKARAEGEAKDRQLAEVASRHAEELAKRDAALAALRTELDQTLANERAEHARALDEAEKRRNADLEQATRDREAELSEARAQAEREKKEALDAQSAHLKQEHDGKLAALHRAQQQELERTRAEAAQALRDAEARHEATLAAARQDADDTLAAARQDAEDKLAAARKEAEEKLAAEREHAEHDLALAREAAEAKERAALETLRAEHAEKIAGLENDRDSRLAALEARATRELGEAHERLAKVDMDLSATRGELAALKEDKAAADATNAAKIADLEGTIAETTASRDDLAKQLAETKQRLGTESARADKAHAKWDADRQSLERAKDALAVALAQIEDAEARPIS